MDKDNSNNYNDINKNKGFETLDNNFVYSKHIINNSKNSNIDDEYGKNNSKIKNKTARNFYPYQVIKKKSKKIITRKC